MTEETWVGEALIESVKAEYDLEGSIRNRDSVVVKVNYVEKYEHVFDPEHIENEDEIEELAERYDVGEVIDAEYRNGAYARLRFDVEDGTASLSSFKDASPEGAGWIGFEFLRTVKAAEDVVANVPGVQSVERVEETLGAFIGESSGAEIIQG